jgi:Bacterial Ig-like domain (group 2)
MIRRLLTIAFAASVAVSCGGSQSSPPSASTGTGTDAGTASPDAGALDIVDIALSQTDVHIPRFTMTAFAVTGRHADGTTVDVTPQAEAKSSNTQVATVEKGPGSQIQIHALDEGTATITVTFGNLQQDCKVTVFSN